MKAYSRSCLYETDVLHRRLWPKQHEFVYRYFVFALDLDEIAERAPGDWLLGINRFGLYSLMDADHFGAEGQGGLRSRAEGYLREHGVRESPGRILLVTNARFLGYTFNPISIWFCEAADGNPLGAIAEVGNTFGELKPYFVPPGERGFQLRTVKEFYVSPFSDLDWEFDFRFAAPGERLGVWIDVYRRGEKALVSSFSGRKVSLSSSSLLRQTGKFPFVTLRVIGLIHWQALRLWWKRVPYHRKEEFPERQRGVFRPHRSLRGRMG